MSMDLQVVLESVQVEEMKKSACTERQTKTQTNKITKTPNVILANAGCAMVTCIPICIIALWHLNCDAFLLLQSAGDY